MRTIDTEKFRLPFKGRWFVAQAGDTLNVNHHMSVRAQWFGIDFMKVGGPSKRALAPVDDPKTADFYSWGQPVLSPVNGKVEMVVDGLPDNPLGTMDPKNPAGNHIMISTASKRYVFLAHFQKGSLKAKVGQKISAGDFLGRCGNSGHSSAPHIHLHVQDAPILNQGTGQNIIFKRINAELSGKVFRKVDWPLIAGLFVWA